MGKRPTSANVYEIARIAAIEALKLQKSDERERVRKNRFHNTELLLKNYLNLLDHSENSKFDASEIHDIVEPLGFENIDLDDVIVQSIKRSKVRTQVMINQIETSIEILRLKTASKNQYEKYEVIEKLFMDQEKSKLPTTERIKVVAEELNCGESSVRRWKNEMINELSVLLFGVDGLKLEV